MSPVAAEDTTTDRTWTRTPEQEQLVRDHLDLVKKLYADTDPVLRARLSDPTIWGTPELVEAFGLSGDTRAFQWYTAGRELAESGQAPHPSGVPVPDASGGHRGARIIRGVMAGRAILWGWQSGKLHWDSINRTFVRQTHIKFGGAPKQYP